jgi:hypothetical protein
MTTGVLLCLALVMTWRNLIWLGASVSLLCWIGLGFVAGCLSRQPLPPDHILSLLAAQEVPLRTPLRWNGTLRTEPSRLPWGYGLDVRLESIDTAGAARAFLRVTEMLVLSFVTAARNAGPDGTLFSSRFLTGTGSKSDRRDCAPGFLRLGYWLNFSRPGAIGRSSFDLVGDAAAAACVVFRGDTLRQLPNPRASGVAAGSVLRRSVRGGNRITP